MASPPAPRSGSLQVLLRLPLFYKILIANATIVVLGSVLGGGLTAAYVRAAPQRPTGSLLGLLAGLGLVVSVAVNALILRLALAPLAQLERTAAEVQGGRLDARAPVSRLADRKLERLIRTFNSMLDTVDAYRGRLREVAVRSLNAAEEERKRVARELHDETAQTLAALLLRIRVIRGREEARRLDPLLEEMRVEVGAALEGVRRFAHGLRPPALEELGLAPALEAYARSLSEVVPLQIAVEAEALDGVLSPEAELAVYRIVQEALSNVVRHAHARRVEVHLGVADDTLLATVQDDGRGFHPGRTSSEQGCGLGLFGMRERAAYLGGEVDVGSEPGRGTRVRVRVPTRKASLTS